ncbi:MAG: hypothetical protein U9Q34_00965 [Elusimicrobiota bacterium]|nr:hypothetical protein [Elusimicrobiota bacterium]
MKKNRGKNKYNKNQQKDEKNISVSENSSQNEINQSEQIEQPDVSRAKVLLFWGIILLLIFLAWGLPKLFNTHEYTIERWLMLVFAGILGTFLYTLRDEPKI